MSWLPLALTSAVLWGLNYSFGERLIKSAGVPALLVSNTIGAAIFIIAYLCLKGGIKQIASGLSVKDIFLMLFCACTSAGAIISVQTAISQKNATMAGLVEMAYPLFTAAFAYTLFGEAQLTASAVIGAALIITGVLFISK